MSNIIDYAQGLKTYSFDKVFFKDLDVLALTEVAYLPLLSKKIVTDDEISLENIAAYTAINGDKEKFYRLSTAPRLNHKILGSGERYGLSKLLTLLIKIDSNIERQFSDHNPIVLDMKYLVVFRGQMKIWLEKTSI